MMHAGRILFLLCTVVNSAVFLSSVERCLFWEVFLVTGGFACWYEDSLLKYLSLQSGGALHWSEMAPASVLGRLH